jgi:hypothetical protein
MNTGEAEERERGQGREKKRGRAYRNYRGRQGRVPSVTEPREVDAINVHANENLISIRKSSNNSV